jgi:hypothetical protein
LLKNKEKKKIMREKFHMAELNEIDRLLEGKFIISPQLPVNGVSEVVIIDIDTYTEMFRGTIEKALKYARQIKGE